ncbi:hypothetical protein [Mesorhizobium sp. WSM3866]|uniref:hypothetical protein n=1 Tax=Mesorhizobium sp. WSM3866 TaxID=422271 RepID=UPI001FDEF0A6|nr:hypothetical protein [Mesorhizobium sp. WSM3866]
MSFLLNLLVGRLGVSRLVAGAIAWAAIAALVSGAAFAVYEVIKHRGAEEVRAKIEKDNQDAIRKGIDARKSLDECIDAGGVYNFRRQRCAGAALGHRQQPRWRAGQDDRRSEQDRQDDGAKLRDRPLHAG